MPECRLVGNRGEKGINWLRIVSYLIEHVSYGPTDPGTPNYPSQFAVDGGISIHPHPPLVIARPLLGSGVLFCTVGTN